MSVLLIVWTTTTGGTRQMVDAAATGAREVLAESPDVELRVLHADDATPQDVLDATSLLFAMPEHLGSMAGPMKTFFDRIYYPCLERVDGRAYALMVCAGTDGQGTVRQVQRIATGLKLRAVAEPLIVLTGAHRPEDILAPKQIGPADLARCRELGALLAARLAAGMR